MTTNIEVIETEVEFDEKKYEGVLEEFDWSVKEQDERGEVNG